MDPEGKVAIVTGGADGIGLAITKQLLKEKVMGVAICDVKTELGEQRVAELSKEFGKGRIIFIKCDVSSQEEFEGAFKKTTETFRRPDILINNAGILNDKKWELEVDINFKGYIRGTLLAYEYMGKNKGGNGGVVVNIASVAAFYPAVGLPIYSALKSGVVGLTLSFGDPFYYEESALRVVAICPSVTDSNIGKGCEILDTNWIPIMRARWCSSEMSQPAECVAVGVTKIIREGKTGSLWSCVQKRPIKEITFPTWDEFVNGSTILKL